MSTKNYSKEALQQWHNDSVRETYLMYNSNTDIMNESYTLHDEDLQDTINNNNNSNKDSNDNNIDVNSKINKYSNNKDNKINENFEKNKNNLNFLNESLLPSNSPSPSPSPSLLNNKTDKMMESVQQPFNILLKNPETSNGNYAYILNIKKNIDEDDEIEEAEEEEDDVEDDEDEDESFEFDDEDNEQEINNIEYDGNKRIKINKDSLEQSWVNLHNDINTSDNILLKRKLKTNEISKKNIKKFLLRKEKIKSKEKSDINNKIKINNIHNKDTYNKILNTNYNSLESSIISYNSSDNISSPSPKNFNINLTTNSTNNNNNNNNFDLELDQNNIPEKYLLDEVNNFLKNHSDQLKNEKKFISISSTTCSSSDFLEERFIQENSIQNNNNNPNDIINKDNTDNNNSNNKNKNDDDLNGVLFQIGCISVIIAGISLSVGLIIGTRHRLL